MLCFLLFISNGETKAQCLERTGMDCLGDWCIVDVSLSDPLVDNYLVYTIPKPLYAISGIYGPGMPRLFNDLGGTMDLYLRKFDLQLLYKPSCCVNDAFCGPLHHRAQAPRDQAKNGNLSSLIIKDPFCKTSSTGLHVCGGNPDLPV